MLIDVGRDQSSLDAMIVKAEEFLRCIIEDYPPEAEEKDYVLSMLAQLPGIALAIFFNGSARQVAPLAANTAGTSPSSARGSLSTPADCR